MIYEFKPSFDRSIKALPFHQKDDIKEACFTFMEFLEKRSPLPGGIGLKRLREDFWEIRKGLRIRVIFRWKDDLIEFVLAGDHNSIKTFLKGL